ncbi:DUF6565 domain-containing protein [Bacteroides sp. 519]|uniref:DUF6565 domain-containing protein n=1 Tax=Bacteroides sp. 519 TaxID=2302937 RepID=UPI0013D4EAD1|nr:DUF6565 domain-containing protein [Bacteroides sp. 519]NDV58675.1 hypothetical protein [Bacteroides sp. 519]
MSPKQNAPSLFIIVIAIMMMACSPTSKESYLNKYDSFITEITKNHKLYDQKDWKKKAEEYNKFAGEWYDKFEDELSLKDEVKIKSYQVKWHYYSNLSDISSTVKELLEVLDVKGLKKQIQYYIDNDMHNDLKGLYKDAIKAGKETKDVVIEILNELNIKIDELN